MNKSQSQGAFTYIIFPSMLSAEGIHADWKAMLPEEIGQAIKPFERKRLKELTFEDAAGISNLILNTDTRQEVIFCLNIKSSEDVHRQQAAVLIMALSDHLDRSADAALLILQNIKLFSGSKEVFAELGRRLEKLPAVQLDFLSRQILEEALPIYLMQKVFGKENIFESWANVISKVINSEWAEEINKELRYRARHGYLSGYAHLFSLLGKMNENLSSPVYESLMQFRLGRNPFYDLIKNFYAEKTAAKSNEGQASEGPGNLQKT